MQKIKTSSADIKPGSSDIQQNSSNIKSASQNTKSVSPNTKSVSPNTKSVSPNTKSVSPIINLKSSKVTGVGSALMDLLINEKDSFLESVGKKKGGMTLVDDKVIESVLEKSGQQPLSVPGGAACNTIAGIAKLGGKADFIAKRGCDAWGVAYEEYLKKNWSNAGILYIFNTNRKSVICYYT
ncbi:hypothetical protein MTBBW1_2210018 [Desulfamplus magnetovallimortis]|uniref:Carbohydrate kinase PfkB domain-containing protein n=1 Tax=Desulfamplus magnetovallimortis TaxID=1246637 RepID=A0A1W1HD42_9BACT|nr:hypothetical protein MTBBW1_2210018 [Desulfamplus magnetovallimortis]